MAVSVGSALDLFQFALQTLGQIQLAREFQEDFEMYQLKLDIIQVRLSRWGAVAAIGTIDKAAKEENQRPQSEEGCGSTLTSVRDILNQIQDRLHKIGREANKLQKKLDVNGSQALDPHSCLPPDLEKLRSRFLNSIRKRKAELIKANEGIKWVFYKKDQFDKFVTNISGLLDSLEQTIPEDERPKLRVLSDEECKGISIANLEDLKDIVAGCDPWLESVIDEKLNASNASTVINQSHNTGSTVGIHHGDNKGISYGANSTQSNTFH